VKGLNEAIGFDRLGAEEDLNHVELNERGSEGRKIG